MGSSGRRKGGVGMTVIGAVLTLVISARHGEDAGGAGHRDEGRAVVEMVVTESFGSFRNIARLLFLLTAAAADERPPR
jgi:hypothetical protein